MTAVLFRSVEVEGVKYYQAFSEVDDFKEDPDIADFDHRDEKDLFYIDADSDIETPNLTYNNIYCCENGKLEEIKDVELHNKVILAFADKYHLIIRRLKSPDEVLEKVKKKILFQDNCIKALIGQIYQNQAIVVSDMPTELKMVQKNNILFHGRKGSGKKTIIEGIEDGLVIPYVDITLSSDVENTLDKIISTLLEQANNNEDLASTGVIFIRDNYRELHDKMGQNVYAILEYLTSLGEINYHGQIIDFRTITFVILLDDYQQTTREDVENFQNTVNCTVNISTKKLTNNQKNDILWSENGRLYHYQRFLSTYGKEVIVDTDSILDLIDRCSSVDTGMGLLNVMIDTIVKYALIGGLNDVIINKDSIELFLPVIDGFSEDEKKEEEVKPKEKEEFAFEKMVDQIVAKVKEDVIGQDKNVKILTYQIANNLLWANREDVIDPKKYIKNILIRGNTGTGKTFIPEKILKCFGVPYFVADATEYTESGYVGKDVEQMLVSLYHAAGNNLKLAERGVLVIDEIDKKVSRANEGSHNIGGGFQEALYKLAEGTKIRINVGTKMNEEWIDFDTSRLTIILSGAFENIEELAKDRCGKRKSGFGSQEGNGQDPHVIDVDYIAYGMETQFMRRVKHIIEFPDATKEQLINIMKQSASSALKVEKETLNNLGIDVEYQESFYDILADKALDLKQGVTGVEKALLKVLQSINIQEIRPSVVKKIIFNGDVVNDPNQIVLVEREKRKVKRK